MYSLPNKWHHVPLFLGKYFLEDSRISVKQHRPFPFFIFYFQVAFSIEKNASRSRADLFITRDHPQSCPFLSVHTASSTKVKLLVVLMDFLVSVL